ncbi:2-dehydropantoate 2-reductase [Streptomyces sp. NPDC006385]|uniref:2-dehydropantoate 2-reductase n=1 Tax=Streptomyces sp. NPDC006385 TaxID=3156761 RepID=UPI0033AF1862
MGAGGIGGYFGGRLAAAGEDVHFVARGAHLDALRGGGLAIESPDGGVSVVPVRATHDSTEIGVVDYVLLCVKTWQLEPALKTVRPLLGPATAVVTVQNGVEAPGQVAEALGGAAVMPGIAKVISLLDSPGRVRHLGGLGLLGFGEWDGQTSDRARRLSDALAGAGIEGGMLKDIWAELWAKFLFIVPFGGLGAAADATIGELRTQPRTRRLLTEAMAEIERVARARNVNLAHDVVHRSLDFVDQQPAAGTSSLQRDLLAGRPSELEALTGAVVRLGAESGVATPVNSFLHDVLSVREARAIADADHAQGD